MFPSRKVLIYEIVGTIFVISLGSTFHFTYELSGKLAIVGIFSSVNESVWEHLKLAFWPSLIWLLIEYSHLNRRTNNFLTAKMLGAYLMIVFIPIMFYSYTSITKRSIFVLDITTFIVAVIVGQLVSYRLYNRQPLPKSMETVAFIAIVLLAIIFITFTFYPPHLPIFQDPINKGYGIFS